MNYNIEVQHSDDGGYYEETRIDGINEFAKETVSNLLKKYPDIDFYDLMFQFEMQFRHEYSKAMLKETSE